MSLSELADRLDVAAASGPSGISEDDRKKLLQAAEKLRVSFENPLESTLRIVFSGHQAMALRVGVDMKLFDAVAKKTKEGVEDSSVTIGQISKETGADPLLVTRIIRLLAGLGIFKEVSKGTYKSTPLAAAYVSTSPLSSAVIHITHFLLILSKLPEYLAKNGWKNPDDVYDGPFQYAMGTTSHYFDFLASQPYYQNAFNTVMTISHRRRGQNWFNFFPVEEKLAVKDPSEVVLVDVGGSQGGDIIAFHEKYPHLPGKLILQDLTLVVESAENLPAGIEAQGYDFFTEQPVKGAKGYYLRTVLHDWPDKQALLILGRLREAMNPDSILLINETVLPETNVALSSAQADLTMMVSFASLERTEKQFEALLNAAGFELIKVWTPEGFESSAAALAEQATLLEARLKAN